MQKNDHYPTFAAFFLNEEGSEADVVSADCAIGDGILGKALIRKRCVCCSVLDYDWDQGTWFCCESGAEAKIPAWNSEPLMPSESGTIHPDKYRPLLSQAKCQGVPAVDAQGLLHLFVKIPHEHLWLLVDPISVDTIMTMVRTEAAPIVRLYCKTVQWVTPSPASLDGEVFLDVSNPEHREFLEHLASGSEVRLHFVDAMTYVVLATKRIKPPLLAPKVLAQTLDWAAGIPPGKYDFQAALEGLALGTEAREMGLQAQLRDEMASLVQCPVGCDILFSGKVSAGWDFWEHVLQCHRCRETFGSHG